MSQDPHAPTPAGPDPDETTEVRQPPADDAFAAPVDPPADDAFAAPVDPPGDDAFAAPVDPPADDAFAAPVDPPADADDASRATVVADEPVAPTPADEPAAPTPTVSFADATEDRPAGTAAPADDWLAPDEAFAAPPADPDGPLDRAKALGDQAKALTDRPEVMVGLAFAGGVVASFVLKRFGR